MKQTVGEYLRHPNGDLENYCEPLCFELAGKTLTFIMSSGGGYTLAFLTEKKAILFRQDSLQLECDYRCLKLKEKLYLITILSEEGEAFLSTIDLTAGFMVFMLPGEKELGFGMIAPVGREGSAALAENAGNMIGHSILWHHSPKGRFVQTFQSIHDFSLSCASPAGSVSTMNCSARYFQLREDIFLMITAILAWDNMDEEYPRLIVSKAIFGAESRIGEPLPAIRHHYTDDLLGKRIVWHYTANDDVLHICFDKTHFRLGYAAISLSPNPLNKRWLTISALYAGGKSIHIMRRRFVTSRSGKAFTCIRSSNMPCAAFSKVKAEANCLLL